MALIGEAELRREPCDGDVALAEPGLSTLDPRPQQIAHRALAGAGPELAREVEAAHSRYAREVVERDRLADVLLDIGAHSLERADVEAAARASGPRASRAVSGEESTSQRARDRLDHERLRGVRLHLGFGLEREHQMHAHRVALFE